MDAYLSILLPALIACAIVGYLLTLYATRRRGTMAYTLHVKGKIGIIPPLTHGELATVKHLTHTGYGLRDAFIAVTEEAEETDQGTLLRRSGEAIVASPGDHSHYHLNDHITDILNEFPDRKYDGYLECHSPDDLGSTWRVMVRDGQVVEVRPTLTWPDE